LECDGKKMVWKKPVGEGKNGINTIGTISISAILILVSFAGIISIVHISFSSDTAHAETVCFVAGTKITMADGSVKNIEDIQIGDMIQTVNMDTMNIEPNQVIELISPVQKDMVRLVFEDAENKNSFDHPYFVKGKGWCSYKPDFTRSHYDFDVGKLEVGDICYLIDENQNLIETKLIDIIEDIGEVQTYNLYSVENNHNFFANGVLVHNKEIGKCFLPGTPINMADGSYKNIEDVEIGDLVKVYNEKAGEIDVAPVHSIQTVYHDNVHELVLENGKILKPTANHPFLVEGKGWCTISGLDEMDMDAGKIEVGDYLYQINSNDEFEWVEVVDIVPFEGNYLTYNFLDMKYGTFIADDIVTHNSVITCFPAGTKIDMADGSYKNIEDVEIGDMVLSYDLEKNEYVSQRVYGLESPVRDGVYDVNDGLISPTSDHPIYIKKSDGRIGWGAMDAEYSKSMHGFDFEVLQIEVGDYFLDVDDNWVLVDSIIYRSGPIQVYTISVENSHTFYANGFLVHNCGSDQNPTIDSFDPSSSTATNRLDISVACSDDNGLSGYAYEWSTSSSQPERCDDGTGSLSDPRVNFTPSEPPSDANWYLHVVIEDNAGQSAYDYSGVYSYDATDPTGSIDIENDEDYTNSRSVSLRLSYSDAFSGVAGVNYSNTQLSEEELATLGLGSWEFPEADKSWTLTSGDGPKTVYYYVKDRAGNIYETSDSITLDTEDPDGSVVVNDGVAYTDSRSVTLTCEYADGSSGVDQVRYSNDGSSWSGLESASVTKSWTLSSGDGSKTVYYEIRDNAGNSFQTTDTIYYDGTDPSASVTINDGDSHTNSTSVTLDLTYSDGASGVNEVTYSNDGSGWSRLESPVEKKEWTLSSGDGEKTVYYKVFDNAGNVRQVTDTILLDTTGPRIQASPESNTLGSSNSYIINSSSVALEITDETTEPYYYRYAWTTDTGTPASEEWGSWTSIDALAAVQTSTSGTWYLHIQANDTLGNLDYRYFGPYEVNNQPTASFTKSSSAIETTQTVTLDASGSSDEDGSISQYEWDLNGDGSYDITTDSSTLTYTFNVSYSYDINLKVTDDDGASHQVSDSVNVKEIRTFYEGRNYFTYRRNASTTAKELANFLGLEAEETIQIWNYSSTVCNWDYTYIVGWTPDENDTTINMYDLLRVNLNNGREITVDFGASDSDITNIPSKTLKFVEGEDGFSNYGYNLIPWVREKSIRASRVANRIALQDTYTISIYNKVTETYKSYVKLPGSPTAYENAQDEDLDPLIDHGDIIIIKVPSNEEDGISFDLSLFPESSSTATDDSG
jgi:hypothetical protein